MSNYLDKIKSLWNKLESLAYNENVTPSKPKLVKKVLLATLNTPKTKYEIVKENMLKVLQLRNKNNIAIPYIPEKRIKLTNAGKLTGAEFSTNMLDSLAKYGAKANLPIELALELAAQESTFGNAKTNGYKGPQYSQVIGLMKREDPQAYNRLLVANARSLQPNSEVVRWTDAEGNQRTSTTNIGMSSADPIGLLYVEGVALNPVFKGLGRVAEYGLAKAGNKWARARLLSRAIDSKSTTYLNNTSQAYKKLSSKQLPKDLSLLYHLNYGTSKLTDKGLIPGKSNNGEDYLWWKEGSQYGNFPERNVYTIPKHRANIVTRGNSEGINPNGDYPLTKEVPLEELTEYSINPMTYGFEKRIFISPNNSQKKTIYIK